MALLEVCCYSMECAREAQNRGADRIELCAAPLEGGLTPSLGVLRSVRAQVTIPVHPIIRPRGGSFATPTASLPRCWKMCEPCVNSVFRAGDRHSRPTGAMSICRVCGK